MSYEIKSNSAWKFEDIFMFHFKNEQNLHFAQGFTNFCNSFVINNSLMKVIIFFLLKVFQRGVDSTVIILEDLMCDAVKLYWIKHKGVSVI